MASTNHSIVVIGGGAMGGSIARGLVDAGVVDASRMSVVDPSDERRLDLASAGVCVAACAQEVLPGDATAVILAVKPQIIAGVMAELVDLVADKLVISIAAGVQIATIEAALGRSRVVRVMPNLPLKVRSGASAIAAGPTATADDVEVARELFCALGCAHVMREDTLDVAGAVSGCSPAFFALFVDALTRAGVRAGLPADAARDLVETTMRGTAQQLIEEGVHPRAYVERVTSPGGTTAAALYELEPLLVEGSYAAVDAALERTRELASN